MSNESALSILSSDGDASDEDPNDIDAWDDLAPGKDFRYSPLDYHQSSIRLVRLCSDRSRDGLLQCSIRHATISDKYTCLSYVWGSEGRGNSILLDGQRFWVRRNLFNFLTRARCVSEVSEKWLWIDALCIDQNTTTERNHQVQQMGQIYSKAEEVISWLGCCGLIAEYLRSASHGRDCKGYLKYFRNSRYWSRAWITQEIVLARRVKFMARSSVTDGGEIPFEASRIQSSRPTMLDPAKNNLLRGSSLIYLIDRFGDKDCSDGRDRIYSLISLCGDGSSLEVDYNKTPSALMRDVLRACKQSFCLCGVSILNYSLGRLYRKKYGAHNELSTAPFAQIRIPSHAHEQYIQLYYGRPCSKSHYYGTNGSHFHDVDEHTANRTSFTVTLELEYLCGISSGLVTFFVDEDMEVIKFECFQDAQEHVDETRLDSHRTANAFGQQSCTIRLPFYILLEMSWLIDCDNDGPCTRVSSPGTPKAVGSNNLLELSVLGVSADDP